MFKSFFYFNTVERKASAVLLLLVAVLWALAWCWPLLQSPKKNDFAAFKNQVADFENDIALAELEAEAEREAKFKSKKFNKYPDFEEEGEERGYRKKNKKEKSEKEEEVAVAAEPFPFDPNTASQEELLSLGLSGRTVHSILNFREKGGKFKKKDDLAKIYTLETAEYQRLASFIQLPDSLERKTFASSPREKLAPAIIEVNSASAEDFQKLPGIGPSFAQRIIKYRTALGGFFKMEQIAEVFGLPDSLYQKIVPQLRCQAAAIQKININQVSIEQLKTHPYLRWKHANAIVKWREKNGPYRSIETLRTLFEFDDAEGTYWKIKAYLTI